MIIRKEMEMKKYMTPEMEVVELKMQSALLALSDGEGSTPGSGAPIPTEEPIEG